MGNTSRLSSQDLRDFNGARQRTAIADLITRPAESHSHFAILVTKRIAPRAVDRNRLKRRIRPMIEHLLASLPSPIDVLVIVKAKARETDNTVIASTLSEALKKL